MGENKCSNFISAVITGIKAVPTAEINLSLYSPMGEYKALTWTESFGIVDDSKAFDVIADLSTAKFTAKNKNERGGEKFSCKLEFDYSAKDGDLLDFKKQTNKLKDDTFSFVITYFGDMQFLAYCPQFCSAVTEDDQGATIHIEIDFENFKGRELLLQPIIQG